MELNTLTEKVLGCAIDIHKQLGPGLLESVYLHCLNFEINKCGIPTAMQVALPVVYDAVKLETGFRIDLLVNNQLIVEIKSVESLTPVHRAQLMTYLKLSGIRLGLLINFNSVLLKDGVYRIIQGYE